MKNTKFWHKHRSEYEKRKQKTVEKFVDNNLITLIQEVLN